MTMRYPLLVAAVLITLIIVSPTAATFAQGVAESEARGMQEREESTINDKILQTVYWALGTIIIVLLVMIGAGWYTNFRIYKKDLDGIRIELKDSIRGEEATLSASLREQTEKLTRSLTDKQKKEIDSAKKALSGELGELQERIVRLEIQMKQHEAQFWEGTQDFVPSNALLAYFAALAMAVKHPHLGSIHHLLDTIKQVLKKAGPCVTAYDSPDYFRTLNALPREFEIEKLEVEKLIKSKLTTY